MAKRRKVGNLLALYLLSLLAQAPMYPYEMAQTMRERGKDKNFPINWGSLYTVVQNLEKHGFIETVEVGREGRQPERTTYQITAAGHVELHDWLRELISEPEREYTRFEAALADSAVLPPSELVDLLQQRLDTLEAANAQHQAGLDGLVKQLPRLFLIESEYYLALRRAEAEWVRGLLKEFTDGTFPGIKEWQLFHDTGKVPEEILTLVETQREGLGEERADS